MDQKHIYNTNRDGLGTKTDEFNRRSSILDSINTEENGNIAGDNRNIDTLPTPGLFIPKRQSRDQNVAQNAAGGKRVLSVLSDPRSNFLSNITNTINTKLDSHPTILQKNSGNNSRTVSTTDHIVPSIYEKKRHISAPITVRKISGTSSSNSKGNTVETSRIYNSTSHYSPTNEVNQTLTILNNQYLEFVENKNAVTSSEIEIIELLDDSKEHKNIYTKQELIGSGNFSDVYTFKRLNDGKLFACKYIKYPLELLKFMKRDKPRSQEMLLKLESSLLREIKILHKINQLRHYSNGEDKPGSKNTITLVGVNNILLIENDSYIQDYLRDTGKLPECYIISDLCQGGNLLHLIKDYKMSIQMIQEIFSQVLLGLNFLHENHIIHRDIKLENILLTLPSHEILTYFENGTPIPETLVKISDFGLSKEIDPQHPLSTTRCGSPDYIPPEILLGLEYDGRLTDVWSFGVCLYAVLEEILPFDSQAVLERQREMAMLQGKMLIQKRRSISDSGRISRCDWKWYYMSNLSASEDEQLLYEQCKEVVQKCLVRRTERMTTSQLLEMDFFNV